MWEAIHNLWLFVTGRYRVSNILKSSHELDDMKKEIQGLLPILILVMNNTCRYSSSFKFKGMGEGGGFLGISNGYAWSVKIHEGFTTGFELRDSHNPGPSSGPLFSYEFKKPVKLEYEEVGVVYSRLQDLVNLLREKIPEFEYQLKHFVKAHKNT